MIYDKFMINFILCAFSNVQVDKIALPKKNSQISPRKNDVTCHEPLQKVLPLHRRANVWT